MAESAADGLWDAHGRYRDRLELAAAVWLCSRGLGAAETACSQRVRRALVHAYERRRARARLAGG